MRPYKIQWSRHVCSCVLLHTRKITSRDLESSATWLQLRWLTEGNRFLMPKITTRIERLGTAGVPSALAIVLINANHNKHFSNKRLTLVMDWSRIGVLAYCIVFILISNSNIALSQCDNRTAVRMGQYPFCIYMDIKCINIDCRGYQVPSAIYDTCRLSMCRI